MRIFGFEIVLAGIHVGIIILFFVKNTQTKIIIGTSFCNFSFILITREVAAGETAEVEAEGNEAPTRSIPRSTSERMLAVHREQINQERELIEKYHEIVSQNCLYFSYKALLFPFFKN